MGTAGLTAQATGAGDDAEVAALLSRALLIGFAAGTVMIVGQIPLFWLAFKVSPASAEVESLARDLHGHPRLVRACDNRALRHHRLAHRARTHTGRLRDPSPDERAQHRPRHPLCAAFRFRGRGGRLGHILSRNGAGWRWASGFAAMPSQGRAWRDKARVFDMPRLKRMAVVNTDILIRSVLLQAIFVSFPVLGRGFRRCATGRQPNPAAIPERDGLRAGWFRGCRRKPCRPSVGREKRRTAEEGSNPHKRLGHCNLCRPRPFVAPSQAQASSTS